MRSVDHHAIELLRAVVLPPAKMQAKAMANIAARITSWDDTIESARLHGILPMLYARLKAIEEQIPLTALELAKREYEHNAFHCMANAAELLQVLKAFELASIPAMPFKGVVLAVSAYGGISMRAAGDLDVLIEWRDWKRATGILKDRGFDLTTPVPGGASSSLSDVYELHFERPSDGMVIELRWKLELTTPRFRRDLGMEWIWPRRTTVQLAGADVPSLDPVSALLVLCMHGSRHTWSRLIWICDVAMLLESQPQLDWSLARREARRVGLGRCLALGVMLAHRVAGAAVPADVLKKFEKDRGARQLAQFIAERMPGEPGKTPDGRVPYNIMLLPMEDRVRLLFSSAFLRPNERDRALIKLPKSLDPLYYLVRPIRVLLDRTARQ